MAGLESACTAGQGSRRRWGRSPWGSRRARPPSWRGSPPRWSRSGGTGCCPAAGTVPAGALESGRRSLAERWPAWVAPRGLYDPPASGPLAGLTPDQVENLPLRAVLDDLKGGVSPLGSMSNGSKCELGERLRRATGLPLRCVTAFLRISKSSYEYHRARLGRDRDADLRGP